MSGSSELAAPDPHLVMTVMVELGQELVSGGWIGLPALS